MRWILAALLTGVSLALAINTADSTLFKPPILYCCSGALLLVLIDSLLVGDRFTVSLSWIHLLFMLYLGSAALSFAVAYDRSLAFESFAYLACYFLICTTVTVLPSKETHWLMDRLFLVLVAITTVIALAQSLSMVPAISYLVSVERQTIATFGNATYFAGFLVLMLPIIICQALLKKSGSRAQILMFFLVMVVLYVLVRTEARSSWVAAIVSLSLLAILNLRSRRTWMIIIVLIGVTGVAASLLFPEIIARRVTALFDFNPTSSLSRRLYFYDGAWKAFLSSPFIGNGIGNFILFLPKFRSPEYWMAKSEDVVPHAHNEYLEILSETGLLGFGLFLGIVFLVLRSAWKASKKVAASDRLMLTGYNCAVIAVLTDNLASMNLRTLPVASSFWIVIGLLYQYLDLQTFTLQCTVSRKLQFGRPLLLLLAAISLWLYVPTVVRQFESEKNFLSGNMLRWQNRTASASEKYQETLSDNPSKDEARLYLAVNFVQQGKYQEARSQINNLLSHNPFYPKARILLAISSFELGDTATALQEIERELTMDNSPQVLYYAASFASRRGEKGSELGYLQTLLVNAVRSKNPTHAADALRQISPLCADKDSSKGCAAILGQVRSAFPAEPEILVELGNSYLNLGAVDAARATIGQVRSLPDLEPNIASRVAKLEELLKR